MVLQLQTTNVWDKYYCDYEEGNAIGIEYPTEALIRYVSNMRKSTFDADEYFNDKGQERSLKTGFDGRVLELGFGTIANLHMVANKGFQELYGLEVSEEAVRRGRMRLAELGIDEKIKLEPWIPVELPFNDNDFSLIYGLQCIYYNLEIEKLISEIFRALKPGGTFMFSFFSTNHGYMKMLQEVEPNIYQWSNNHKNKRLIGACFRQPKSREELVDWFSRFEDIHVFVHETDQLPVYQSWWYITGRKPLANGHTHS